MNRRAVYIISKLINIFAIVCLGAYTAVAIEYGLDITLAVGIALSAILATLTIYIKRKAIEK